MITIAEYWISYIEVRYAYSYARAMLHDMCFQIDALF